ncbi:MAG: hydrogenase nickel incorporation protein HypB [Alphaproteobacteria bacterium]
MCSICGCGADDVRIEGKPHTHKEKAGGEHNHHGHEHSHSHDHNHHHHNHDHSHGHHHSHAPGTSEARKVQIEQDLLAKNDAFAAENRAFFARHGIFALNLVSSPGAGKTALLVRTISELKDSLPLGVIEGDQQTLNDAERIRASGAPAIQINTGKGCHLDAHMVGHALENLEPADGSALFIENVGNLVCPAGFDLGEAHKVVILSVTEGDDKPLKYPDMFAASSLMLVNKADLLPHVDFNVETAIANAQRINPEIKALTVSAKTGEGMDAWLTWLKAGCASCSK